MKKIAFITDIHLNEQYPLENGINPEKNLRMVLDDISKRGIREIVFGGDIGDSSSHPLFFNLLKPFNLKLVLGNHDTFSEAGKWFLKSEGTEDLYYKSENEWYKFFFLDSSKEHLNDDQLSWIGEEINTSKKLVLFIHHPVLKVETYVDELYPLRNRESLRELLKDNAKQVYIFCGHYHMSEETKERNLKQTITQALSYQLKKNPNKLQVDNSEFGYRIIEFEKEEIKTELITFKST